MRIYLVNAESGWGYRAGLMEAEHALILESFAISDSQEPLAFKPVDPSRLEFDDLAAEVKRWTKLARDADEQTPPGL